MALVHARLAASGRDFTFPLRAGVDTAGERLRRAGRPRARCSTSARPSRARSPRGPGPATGYEGSFVLPGRYYLDGVGIERALGGADLPLVDVLLYDAVSGRVNVSSAAARYLSDAGRFREAAVTPLPIRLFEVPASGGRARVVAKAHVMPAPADVLAAERGLGPPTDPLKERR